MAANEDDIALQALVEKHSPYLEYKDDKSKIRCTLNGHELPAKIAAVKAFVEGKKFRHLKAKKEAELGLEKYEPFLVPSINFPNMVFCALTNQLVKKTAVSIQEHLKGRKFFKAQERFQQDLQDLFEEPSIEEMEQAIVEMNADKDQVADEFEFIPDGEPTMVDSRDNDQEQDTGIISTTEILDESKEKLKKKKKKSTSNGTNNSSKHLGRKRKAQTS